MRRLLVGAAAAAAVGAVTLIVLPNVAQAASGCQVTYTTNDWGTGSGGFTASVTVTNLGDAVSAWTLRFGFPNGQQITQGWSANWSQSGANVTATNMTWNGNLGTGASTAIGFNGSWTGSNGKPTNFSLNNVACTGTTVSSSPTPSPSTSTSPPPSGGTAPALHVSGNKLLTASGAAYRLLGVNRSGGEFACIQGNGIWDGPMDQASITAMRSWKIRTVRVPLNEECWLGTADVPAAYGGATYQNAVKAYVNLLVSNGITPIVEMHWNYGQYTGTSSGCSDVKATCQKPMPDAQYAPSFWTGVANAFKGNDAVVFDLFNEPYPDMPAEWDKTLGWQCLRDGGTCTGLPYEAAGMQDLVDAVRATGATNMLMVGGLEWANDLREWLAYKPIDPLNNIAASWHAYSFNACATESCWDSQIAPLAEQVPVVLGEFGQDNCGFDYMQRLVDWADAHRISYLAWTWSPWGCTTGAVLIKDYNGTPEPGVGDGYKAHLLTQTPYA